MIIRQDAIKHQRSPLKWARLAFTGRLATISRSQAIQLVELTGGQVVSRVTRLTSYLVVGMRGWPLRSDGSVSKRLERAEALNRRGARIRIISERTFLEITGFSQPSESPAKTFDADHVCRLMKIDPQTLRRWEQFGLVQASGGRYDFQDLVSVQTIVDLVGRGVRVDTISRSITELSGLLPGTDRPLAQLRIVDANASQLIAQHGDSFMTPDGQLVLNYYGGPQEPHSMELNAERATAMELFEYALQCELEEDYTAAAYAYRRSVELKPKFSVAHFNLGNVLREMNQPTDAESSYLKAIECNPIFATAMYNLADLIEEQGRIDQAIQWLERTIETDADFADAHFNLAVCLQRQGRAAEAAKYWASYLKLDPNSEWADIARQHLGVGSS